MWLQSYSQFITDRFGKVQHRHLFGGASSRRMALKKKENNETFLK